MIIEDCYWYVEGEGEDAHMAALCTFCAAKFNKGWYWPGKQKGYGEYDLFCRNCNNLIYLKQNENKSQETKTPG